MVVKPNCVSVIILNWVFMGDLPAIVVIFIDYCWSRIYLFLIWKIKYSR